MKFEKVYKLNGEINKVREILQNLKYYGELHPLIKSVEKMEVDTDGNKEFLIRERPYKWIPITIVYSAEVKCNENTVEYIIKGIPLAKPLIKYDLVELSKGDIDLNFELIIEGLLPGKSILLNKMVKAQDQLMASINKELLHPKVLIS